MGAQMTGNDNWFENFEPGRRIRHARGATIGEVENNFISKQVMNTAQGHWNEDIARNSPWGSGRIVFGLVTASLIFGLASQDCAENALMELEYEHLRFLKPVHHGDTLYALTEVLDARSSHRDDAGIVRFKHWGIDQNEELVFEGERSILIKRKSSWAAR